MPTRVPAPAWREIAHIAGVGIGTLYRHFPTRDALVSAVYRNETTQLAAAAKKALPRHIRPSKHFACGWCSSWIMS
ncbi:TetR/AcrR family transcriptional regulator [Rhizobium beringeri]